MHLTALAVGALTHGCAEKHVDAWTPKPLVQWADISARGVAIPTNSYEITTPKPTHGLFPAAMSVSRIAITDGDEENPMPRPRLLRDPRNEVLQWNSAFDDQMAISEVFPIAQCDLGGSDAYPEQVLAAMHALNAQIGLVYGMNELSESETEMIGVLFETSSGKPVASFHAQAVSKHPSKEERDRDPEDLWECDSKALVRERFERIVHTCVRKLIANDLPADVETPEGWIPAGPIRPVRWPPNPYVRRGAP